MLEENLAVYNKLDLYSNICQLQSRSAMQDDIGLPNSAVHVLDAKEKQGWCKMTYRTCLIL